MMRPRIIVDPNAASRRDPDLTPALFKDADWVPATGDVVVAHQPDADGSDFVGTATVDTVDAGLIYLRVDWDSFKDVPA